MASACAENRALKRRVGAHQLGVLRGFSFTVSLGETLHGLKDSLEINVILERCLILGSKNDCGTMGGAATVAQTAWSDAAA